jgi:hypothetical protein
MNLLPVMDVDNFPDEVAEAFEAFCALEAEILEDYLEWSLVMPAWTKQNISDDSYEQYRTVTDYLLEELENSELDNGHEYVLIRTY